MGRNKIKIEKIENSKIRQVTFYKRKRGLLKKAMELSLLCESKIFLCIVDKVEKLTIYSSENDINKFLGTYIQKMNQNKVQKDILSNTDYHALFNSAKAETCSKLPSEDVYSHFEEDKRLNNIRPDEYTDNRFMGFNDNFESYMNNEKDNDFNLYLNNQHSLFEEEQDLSSNTYKLNTFKSKSEEDISDSSCSQNLNQVFSTVFATDSSSGAKSSKGNVPACPVRKTNAALSNKRTREELNTNTLNNKLPNKTLENLQNNGNINFAVINSQNLANLFPNLNLLSQNIGVVNWVVPMNNVENN